MNDTSRYINDGADFCDFFDAEPAGSGSQRKNPAAQKRDAKYFLELMFKENNCHNPSNGQFCSGSGSGGGGDDAAAKKRAAKARVMEMTQGLSDDDMLAKLREVPDLNKYFKMDTPGLKLVPIEKLENIRARPEGITNALRIMYTQAVGGGPMGPRGPVSVQPAAGGGFKIFDGNSTFNIAKQAGWSHLPCVVVDDSGKPVAKNLEVQLVVKENNCHDELGRFCSGGGGGGGANAGNSMPPRDAWKQGRELFTEAEMSLPASSSVRNSATTKEEIFAVAGKVKEYYDVGLDTGQGVDKRLGAKSFRPSSIEEFNEALKHPGPIVVLAPLKSDSSAERKVRDNYGGDWGRLHDSVRATVAVEKASDIHKALDAVRSEMGKKGFRMAAQPEDRITKPLDGGYRDVQLRMVDRHGVICELQVHVKPMLVAKELKGGHKLYEEARIIKGAAKRENRDMTASEQEKYSQLRRQMERLYNEAWKEARTE